MKIRSNKKHETNDNKINRKIKEEIMSVVITKLLNQIQNLYKKYEKLKKENSLLKNDLIYILKRVLLNKNDYIDIINNNTTNVKKNYQGKTNYSVNGLKNSSYFNSKSYNSFLSSTEKINNENSNYNQLYYNRNNNSINKKQIEKRRYSIDDDFKKGNNSSSSHLETSLQFNIQNKVDYYLNSLYKHNFAEECISGTTSIHLLNKNQNLYDELFTNKNNRNKSLSHINTDSNFRKVSYQKNRQNLYNSDDYNDTSNNNKYNVSDIRYTKNNNSNYLKVHKKEKINNMKSKIKLNEYNKKKNTGSYLVLCVQEYVRLKCFVGRFQQPVAGIGTISRKDDGLWVEHGSKVCQSDTQHFASTAIGLYSQFVALLTTEDERVVA